MWVTSFKSVTSVFWLESNIGSFYISDIKKLGWFLQLNSTYIIFIVYYISLKTLKMHYYNTGKGMNIFLDANGYLYVSCKTIPWFFFTFRSPESLKLYWNWNHIRLTYMSRCFKKEFKVQFQYLYFPIQDIKQTYNPFIT